MNSTERDILFELRQLETAVQQLKTANPKPDLLPIFTRLDQLTASLPKGTSPDLLHYLYKKSYEKARLWLEGREAENEPGTCRH